MNKCEKILASITTKLASAMIEQDAREWPPVCSILAYQPVHPNAKALADTTDEHAK